MIRLTLIAAAALAASTAVASAQQQQQPSGPVQGRGSGHGPGHWKNRPGRRSGRRNGGCRCRKGNRHGRQGRDAGSSRRRHGHGQRYGPGRWWCGQRCTGKDAKKDRRRGLVHRDPRLRLLERTRSGGVFDLTAGCRPGGKSAFQVFYAIETGVAHGVERERGAFAVGAVKYDVARDGLWRSGSACPTGPAAIRTLP